MSRPLEHLRNHLDTMKRELEETTSQIKRLEAKNKTWNDFSDDSIDMLKMQQTHLAEEISRIQKAIKKSRSKTLLVAELTVLPAVFLLIFATDIGTTLDLSTQPADIMKTKYFTENIRGDTVDTWKSWRLVGTTLNVNIIKSPQITERQIAIIKNAITSTRILTDSQGTSQPVYEGWAGALMNASVRQTKYNIPTEFNFVESNNGAGDIIITLSSIRDADGYTGYTKSIIEENEILKSFITIYDVSDMPDGQLATIVRHEFGHALGLGHSTAQEDLMAPSVDMTVPYVSECNIDAIVSLYNGNEGKTVCG